MAIDHGNYFIINAFHHYNRNILMKKVYIIFIKKQLVSISCPAICSVSICMSLLDFFTKFYIFVVCVRILLIQLCQPCRDCIDNKSITAFQPATIYLSFLFWAEFRPPGRKKSEKAGFCLKLFPMFCSFDKNLLFCSRSI